MAGICICNTTTCFVQDMILVNDTNIAPAKVYQHIQCCGSRVLTYSKAHRLSLQGLLFEQPLCTNLQTQTPCALQKRARMPIISMVILEPPVVSKACTFKKLCCFCLGEFFIFQIIYLYEKTFWKQICWQLEPLGTTLVAAPVYMYAESSAVQPPTVRGQRRYV